MSHHEHLNSVTLPPVENTNAQSLFKVFEVPILP